MFLGVRFINALPVRGGVGLKPNLQCLREVGLQPGKHWRRTYETDIQPLGEIGYTIGYEGQQYALTVSGYGSLH